MSACLLCADHADLNITHASAWVELIASSYSKRVHTVLDVGCSHGRGVSLLWERGIRASGVDISQTAVARAQATRKHAVFCPAGDCFRVGTAAPIPFGDKQFDAAMSTDVLEHLLPHEVPAMARELVRVTRKFLFLSISNKPTCGGCNNYIEALHRNGHHKNITRIHSTNMPKQAWLSHFQEAGAELLLDVREALQESKNNLAFVLRVL